MLENIINFFLFFPYAGANFTLASLFYISIVHDLFYFEKVPRLNSYLFVMFCF